MSLSSDPDWILPCLLPSFPPPPHHHYIQLPMADVHLLRLLFSLLLRHRHVPVAAFRQLSACLLAAALRMCSLECAHIHVGNKQRCPKSGVKSWCILFSAAQGNNAAIAYEMSGLYVNASVSTGTWLHKLASSKLVLCLLFRSSQLEGCMALDI